MKQHAQDIIFHVSVYVIETINFIGDLVFIQDNARIFYKNDTEFRRVRSITNISTGFPFQWIITIIHFCPFVC